MYTYYTKCTVLLLLSPWTAQISVSLIWNGIVSIDNLFNTNLIIRWLNYHGRLLLNIILIPLSLVKLQSAIFFFMTLDKNTAYSVAQAMYKKCQQKTSGKCILKERSFSCFQKHALLWIKYRNLVSK
jgi:hypothetical protein